MSLILALPQLEFSIGNYQFNAYTYPPWSSLFLQLISFVLNIIFLKKVEKDTPVITNGGTEKKNIFISVGVVLILAIFFFDGYFLSTITYSLPIVMLDTYEWYVVIISKKIYKKLATIEILHNL